MKTPMPLHQWMAYGYRINHQHFAYIAGKLLRPRDAIGVLAAIVTTTLRDAYRDDRSAIKALPHIARGFVRGLRRREPVRAEVSHMYRRNMHSFASPLTFARDGDASQPYFAKRSRFYPQEAATLEIRPSARF